LLQDGSVAVTGSTSSASYETFPKVQQWQWPPSNDRPYDASYNGGATDAVLTIFTQDGAQLVSSTYYGGGAADVGKSIFSDSRGRIVLVGESSSLDLPIVGGLQTAPRGGSDVMAALFNPKARTLVGSTFYGGSGVERVSMAVPETDDLWLIVGTTTSDDLPTLGAGATSQRKGAMDGFVAKIGLASVIFSTTIGWTHDDEIHSMLVDLKGDLYLAGNSNSPVITLDHEALSGVAKNDAIVVKWAFGSIGITAPRGGERLCVGQSINVNWNTIDMGPLEPFTLERSETGDSWIPIVSKVTGRAYTWRPTSAEVNSKGVFVRVTTLRGHVSMTMDRVIVDPLVTIEPLPSSQVACAGERFNVETRTTGADLRYTWRRNGVALSQQGSSLVLDPVTATSAGKYECYVTGGCGQTVGSTILTVSVSTVPAFTLNPDASTVNEGASVDFRASAEPLGDYEWFKVGLDKRVGAGPVFRFAAVKVEDAGWYWCRVSSSCGKVDSDTAELLVNPVSVGKEAGETIALSIHPNPASGQLRIQCERPIESTSIVNLVGQMVLQLICGGAVHMGVDLDVTSLPTGPYSVRVRDSSGSIHASPLLIDR
ncbi:MAG: hypothetical protein NTX15_05010, partial [Candidatus Kapabacteria bacterium]|nr:hypothetical protein [Candidatus Kapabacteria bacterium]